MKSKRRTMNGKPLPGSSLRLLTSALLLVALLIVPLQGFRVMAQADEGVRADLPLGGELKVENRRGDISVEVWQEKHVSVSATVEGETPRRSPVLIQRTEALLTIGVVRAPAGKSQRVDLHLRIPERSRVEIVTTDGNVELRGVPSSLSAQTVAGDIRAEMPNGADANIRAETVSGTIFSAIAAPDDVSSERIFEARSGRGTHTLLFKSERGDVTLAPTDAVGQSAARVTPSPEPRPTPARVSTTESA
ncbi:MAG TPA: DUF4097 family beta strand repeat-containing protein, partial [Pyrinomonadaceae bacterium]|nr:DUF4097 family beta strand repeat-containing protein [Pyrinomonadaceae bacterium]